MNYELPKEGPPTLKELPDLSRIFKLMKLNDLLQVVSERTLLGVCIQNALHKRPMDKELLQQIWESYVDNQTNTVFVVGEEAISLIAEVLHK